MRRQPQVALEFELRDGVQTRCAAGMSRHEDQIAGGGSVGGPPQPLAQFQRRAALVRPNEREVEVVAGKHEVVGVAAEESGVELGNENQTYILEPPIPVQVVLAAPVQRHDLAPHVVARRALALDCGKHRRAGSPESLTFGPLRCRAHTVGHVGDRGQLIQLHAGTSPLVRRRAA